MKTIAEPQLRILSEQYLKSLSQLFPGAMHVTDKRPDNFLYIGLIKRLFPAAKIVHTTRDPLDNCLNEPKADQRDVDQDGYGSLCDSDYDQDGSVGATDFVEFKAAYGTSLGQPGYSAEIDVEGDGSVGASGFLSFKDDYGGAPGPSGLGCAGTSPCP